MASNQLMARISGCHSYEFNVCRLESKWRLCRPLNQDLQQFIRVCFNGPTNLDEFDDVDTPFATFVFGDKRLRPTNAFGEFTLGQAGSFSRPDPHIAKRGLLSRMDGLV